MKNIFNERPLLKLGLKSASLMAASYGLMYSSWFCAQKINKKEIKEDNINVIILKREDIAYCK